MLVFSDVLNEYSWLFFCARESVDRFNPGLATCVSTDL